MKKYRNEKTGQINIESVGEFLSLVPNKKVVIEGETYHIAIIKLQTEHSGIKTVNSLCHEMWIDSGSPTGGFDVGQKYAVIIEPGQDSPIVKLTVLFASEEDEEIDLKHIPSTTNNNQIGTNENDDNRRQSISSPESENNSKSTTILIVGILSLFLLFMWGCPAYIEKGTEGAVGDIMFNIGALVIIGFIYILFKDWI